VKFRTASGKTLITSAGLGFKQGFFLYKSFKNKLYEYEAVFKQLLSEKKLFDLKVNLSIFTNFHHILMKFSYFLDHN
jgi:hypothetical protein